MAIPIFRLSQSSTHVQVQIQCEACNAECSHRVVVDSGNVFGVACKHFHLPLIFPDNTLVDGSAAMDKYQPESSILLTREGDKLTVDLIKKNPGVVVQDLQKLKPSVFPLLEDDEEGRNEERLLGLAMLQRGVDAMKAQERSESETATLMTHHSAPRPPKLPKVAKTKVHECFREAALDADELTYRKVTAYEQEERHWDEGMYLDNYVDEEGEVKHLIEAKLEPSLHRDEFKQNETDSYKLHKDMHLLLLELLLAQAYERRSTLGDSTVESAWTICSLCRSLVSGCFPDSKFGDTVSSILLGSIRRQLSFPLYRNWRLSLVVCRDTIESLRQSCCRNILSSIRRLFDNETEDEAMHIYSKDVISPLIANFNQYFSATSLNLLADKVEAALQSITQNQVGGNWGMEELEVAAREALEQGEGGYV